MVKSLLKCHCYCLMLLSNVIDANHQSGWGFFLLFFLQTKAIFHHLYGL